MLKRAVKYCERKVGVKITGIVSLRYFVREMLSSDESFWSRKGVVVMSYKEILFASFLYIY